ncbi:MAG TPA: diacylglycerol kinase family protein [Galbitalea sp.]|jgi:diacylglycerol kinase family enzyme
MAESAEIRTAVKTAAVVYNPVKVNLKTLKAAVKAVESRAGWNKTLWYETSIEDPGGGVTATAIEDGADVVVAAGGDGTVRAVAEALRGTGVALGLVPSGTGNLLARNLSMALDNVQHAVETVFEGEDRAVDIGVVEAERADGSRSTHAFLVMAGLGLDAQMIANTNPALKARVGWLAYAGAIIRALRHHDSVRIRYSVDGGAVRSASVNTVLVGNCGVLPANLVLLPEAIIDDGIFDIVAFRPNGFFGWIQIWNKIVWENGVLRRSSVGRRIIKLSPDVRALAYLKGSEFTLRLEHPEEFELDGDPFGEAIALKTSVDHLALIVRVPAAS